MRERLHRFTLASAVVVVVMFCPKASAQQTNQPAPGQAGQRVAGGQDQARTPAEGETIRGVVAAITVEGEAILDYRTNTAARAEAGFLTIVGSPHEAWAGNAGNRSATATDNERAGATSSNKKRHNVYIAWLTPRTKVCEANDDSSGRTDTNRAANAGAAGSSDKKECTLDQLEVGDHVEIKFSPGESTAQTPTQQCIKRSRCEASTGAIARLSATRPRSRSCPPKTRNMRVGPRRERRPSDRSDGVGIEK